MFVYQVVLAEETDHGWNQSNLEPGRCTYRDHLLQIGASWPSAGSLELAQTGMFGGYLRFVSRPFRWMTPTGLIQCRNSGLIASP